MVAMTAAKLRSNSWFLNKFGDGETDVRFDNSGAGTLLVPGFGLPLDLELKPAERFAHGAQDWAQPRLTAREVTMLRLMNRLTDAPDWDFKVLENDESEAIALLRQEALTHHLLSPAAWQWCLTELRDKAATFKETGLVSVFDSASCVVKSDVLISRKILEKLQTGTSSLVTEVSTGKGSYDLLHRESDFTSNKRTMNLVDPSLFPLIFGRTKVLSEGGSLDLANTLASIGQGKTAPDPAHKPLNQDELSQRMSEHWTILRPNRHSYHSQCLPCEVSFTGEPGTTSVRITSYINNLHPISHRLLYRTIEEVISLSIKPWNEILVRRDRPRKPPRIRCYGVPWLPPYPQWAYTLPVIERDKTSKEYQEAKRMVQQFLAIPDRRTKKPGLRGSLDINLETWGLQRVMNEKYQSLRFDWGHPEPGQAFSYPEWRVGKGGLAVVPKLERGCTVLSQPDHEFYTVSLQDTFREQGLQIIVKLTTAELTPENPSLYVQPQILCLATSSVSPAPANSITTTTVRALTGISTASLTSILSQAAFYASLAPTPRPRRSPSASRPTSTRTSMSTDTSGISWLSCSTLNRQVIWVGAPMVSAAQRCRTSARYRCQRAG